MKFRLPWNKRCDQPKQEKEWKGTRCPCWDNDWTLCLHPEASIVERRDVSMFADEPRNIKLVGYCKYKRYTGPTIYKPRSMTEEEYYKFLAGNTGCFHPEEYDYVDSILSQRAAETDS